MSDTPLTIVQQGPVEYAEFGDPRGTPTIFFHGFVGSYYQALAADVAARQAGLRIIAPNRAGVGKSVFVRSQCFRQMNAALIELLTKRLGVRECNFIAVSGGTPHALACVEHAGLVVRAMALVSPLGPLRVPAVHRGFSPRLRTLLSGIRIPGIGPMLARTVLGHKRTRFLADLRPHVLQFIRRVSPADLERFMNNTERCLDFFVADHRSVLEPQHAAQALAQELQRYWQWQIARPTTEWPAVALWHGHDDTLVPRSSAQYLAQALGVDHVRWLPGGHFAGLGALRDICQFLANPTRASC